MQQDKNSHNSPLFMPWAGVSQDSRSGVGMGAGRLVRIISALCELKRVVSLIFSLKSCGYRVVFGSHNTNWGVNA